MALPSTSDDALRRREASLKKAQAIARMGSWTIDPGSKTSSKTMICSEEACRILGIPFTTAFTPISREEFATRIHPDDREQVMADFQAALSGELRGELLDIGYRIRVNGETLWVQEKAELVFDANGHLLEGTGIVQDVTSQNMAAQQLSEMVDFTGKIIAESPVGIAVFHTDGPCVLANESMAKIFGEHIDSMRAHNFRHLPEWRQLGLLDVATDALQSGKTVRKMATGLKRDGKNISIDCEFAPIIRQGSPHLMVLIRDISDFHAAEQALKEATLMAEEANRAKSEFLANMSHEIRTPMNAVIGLAQLVLDQTTDPKLGDYLRQMYSSATSLLRIINDILDYSKIEAGRLSIEHKEFNTSDLTRNVLGMFSTQAVEKGISLSASLGPDVPLQLVGDSLRLDQILINLVSNAVKFTEHGRVEVEISRPSAAPSSSGRVRLRFAVTDSGLGMSKDVQAMLFQPFIQADGSITRRFGGTGLGLTISRHLVKIMGGDIQVASTHGNGSCFSFELDLDVPIMAPSPSFTAIDSPLTAARKLDLATIGRPIAGARVLLVEDDLINQRVISEVLRRAGLEVIIANHGGEALEIMQRQTVDAVLMDLEMPEVNGFEATRRIRANPEWARLPVIAFTAAVLLHDRAKCLAAGMTDFITKPTQPRALLNILLRHIPPRHAFKPDNGDEPDSDAESFPLDMNRVAAALEALEGQLEQNAFIAAGEMQELRLQLDGLTKPALNHLYDAISRYDYASAKRSLAELVSELGLSGENSA